MKRVFVDTGFFFAHLVAEDRSHAASHVLFERATREAWTLTTTNAVEWESYTLLRARSGGQAALKFLRYMEEGLCEVERVQPADEVRAIKLLRQYTDKAYSFCDALSFVVMERMGLTEAVTFDEDFRSYGRFVILS